MHLICFLLLDGGAEQLAIGGRDEADKESRRIAMLEQRAQEQFLGRSTVRTGFGTTLGDGEQGSVSRRRQD